MQVTRKNRAFRLKDFKTSLRMFGQWLQNAASCAFVFSVLALAAGCRPSNDSPKPSIRFRQIPPAQTGGSNLLDHINGVVLAGKPGMRIVVYARSADFWWIQPFRAHEFAEVASDGSWETATHLGISYAALLVAPGYRPPAKVSALPPVDNSILSVAITRGASGPLVGPHTLQFSGYQW
jgi:hypothetical protein